MSGPSGAYQQLAEALATIAASSASFATSLEAMKSQLQAMNGYITARYGVGILPGGPPAMNDQFAREEFPLAIGTLTGVRYWNTSPPVRSVLSSSEVVLHGARAPWEPGENQASCNNPRAVREPFCNPPAALNMYAEPGSLYQAITEQQYTHRPHFFDEIPDRSCGCGFWVYWSPSAAVPGITKPDVCGIVEGWGRYRGGEKGFRCSKAKIVALCITDTSCGDLGRARAEDLLAERYKVPIFSTVATMLKAHPPSRNPSAEKLPSPETDPYAYGRAWRTIPQPVQPQGLPQGNGSSGGGGGGGGGGGIPPGPYAGGGYVPPPVPVQWAAGCWIPAPPPAAWSAPPCMACHNRQATIAIYSAALGPVYHCDSCRAPLGPCDCKTCTTVRDSACPCGRTHKLWAGQQLRCDCGALHQGPVLSAASALAQLQEKKDPPS